MFKEFNATLTKGALVMTEQYSQRNLPKEFEEQRFRIVTQKSAKDVKKQEITKQLTRQQKTAAIFIKNIIRSSMKKLFKKMLERLVIKKTAYKLLTSKKKRDIEAAFLQIKHHKIRSQHQSLQAIRHKYTELKILASFLNKKQYEDQTFAFNCIKNLSLRAKKIAVFSEILCENVNHYIVSVHYLNFFNRLREIDIIRYQQELKAQEIAKIDKIRILNLQQYAFSKIIDTILLGECQDTSEMRRSKNQEFIEKNATRKQTITQLKEQLKTTKTSIEQQKLNRNRVFQERKKFNNSSKVAMIDAVRKFEKQFKAEDIITKDIESICNERKRVISIRDRLDQKSQGSHTMCLNLLASLSQVEGDKIKKLSDFRPEFNDELERFKQSEEYYLKANAKLQKLIEVYEKRESYNYESEYYELEYENNVIREMIRCFMKQKSFVEILLRGKNLKEIVRA